MSELNVLTLHAGLERVHGVDAIYLSGKSTTSFVYLVSPQGLPVDIGWFDNSRKSHPESNMFAVNTNPDGITNVHHRFTLAQLEGDDDIAYLTEERWADYLEGYDEEPNIVSYDQLRQPDIAAKLRSFVLDACVLPSSVGHDLAIFAWENAYDVPIVEAYGRALITAGNYLVRIDVPTLNGYTAQD